MTGSGKQSTITSKRILIPANAIVKAESIEIETERICGKWMDHKPRKQGFRQKFGTAIYQRPELSITSKGTERTRIHATPQASSIAI